METAAEIIAIARETLGTPYQHQQRINGIAMDCAGPVIYTAKRLGNPVEEILNYGRLPNPAEMQRALSSNLIRVPRASIQLADVVWMRIENEPQHLGIICDYPHGGFSLLHATNAAGIDAVVEHRLDRNWMAKILSVWRWPETL